MIGHLGTRVSALLDGHLTPAEEERAWEHVHACHPCRDLVEREGWVKTRLAELRHCAPASTPSMEGDLRRSLLRMAPDGTSLMQGHVPDSAPCVEAGRHKVRHLAALGGGALGVAVAGVLALGAVPANAPQIDRRGPVTSLTPPGSGTDFRMGGQSTNRPSLVRLEGNRATLVP